MAGVSRQGGEFTHQGDQRLLDGGQFPGEFRLLELRLGQAKGCAEFVNVAAGGDPGIVLAGAARKQQASFAVVACFGGDAHRLAKAVSPLGQAG